MWVGSCEAPPEVMGRYMVVIGIKRIQAVGLLNGVPTLAVLSSGQYPASWNHDSTGLPKYQLVGLTSAGVPTLLKLASDGSFVS